MSAKLFYYTAFLSNKESVKYNSVDLFEFMLNAIERIYLIFTMI